LYLLNLDHFFLLACCLHNQLVKSRELDYMTPKVPSNFSYPENTINLTTWKTVVIVILLNSKIYENDIVNKSLCYFCNTKIVETKILNEKSLVNNFFECLLNPPKAGLFCLWICRWSQISPVPVDTYISSPACSPEETDNQKWIMTELNQLTILSLRKCNYTFPLCMNFAVKVYSTLWENFFSGWSMVLLSS